MSEEKYLLLIKDSLKIKSKYYLVTCEGKIINLEIPMLENKKQ